MCCNGLNLSIWLWLQRQFHHAFRSSEIQSHHCCTILPPHNTSDMTYKPLFVFSRSPRRLNSTLLTDHMSTTTQNPLIRVRSSHFSNIVCGCIEFYCNIKPRLIGKKRAYGNIYAKLHCFFECFITLSTHSVLSEIDKCKSGSVLCWLLFVMWWFGNEISGEVNALSHLKITYWP